MDDRSVISWIKSQGDKRYVEDMARVGIPSKNIYGVSMAKLRGKAKELGVDHDLAQKLWKTRIYEAMILASLIDDPKFVTEKQMDDWVKRFDSWGVCDCCCGNLFDKTPFAFKKAKEWCASDKEFVKRAGYVLIAAISVHDKMASDDKFLAFLPIIEMGSTDERNFVKKGVNWALREIGKRNRNLNKAAIGSAERIRLIDSRSAKWIAADALRELKSEAAQRRFYKSERRINSGR
ncbi:MAG: DNA alkylation repair protein [Candidatus Marsarchaeota archaeon]|nr:DNA alkylation repair protein [Candidatus Marsarchaeota archaeon]